MALYKHEQIDLTTGSFRVLRLLKGEFSEIQCELFTVWLGQDTSYETLSYTWGSTQKTATITINDGLMNITENLYMALWNLRQKNVDRYLWVDAICIEQDNLKERRHQVGHMGTIYKEAEQVIVWLGQATVETDIIMDSINVLKESQNDWARSPERWREFWPSSQSTLGGVHPELERQQRAGLVTLLDRPWFRRVWVLQEVANARAATVVCGSKTVPARIFAMIPAFLGVNPDTHCQSVLDVMPGYSRQRSWWSRKRDLSTLLIKFGGSEATDTRDMVYALLGISSDACDCSAISADYSKTLQEVIEDTASFLLRDSLTQGNAVLRTNAERGVKVLVQLLLDSKTGELGAAFWASNGETPLSWAAKRGDEAVVKLLLKMETVDVNSRDNSNRTPLSWAAEKGQEAMAKLLLETGKVDVDSRDNGNRTPLSWAAEQGHEDIVKLLLDTGMVNVDSRDDGNRAPLLWAVKQGHEAVVKLLLESDKIVINPKDNKFGRTPLAWAAKRGDEAVVKLLLKTGGADINSKDNLRSQTPLSYAAENGHKAVVRLLLKMENIDVNSKDSQLGQTPLSIAAERGHVDVVKQLIEMDKVDADSKDGPYNRTPLSRAAENGHEAVVKLLLETGKVGIDSKNGSHNRTALSRAAENGHDAVVKLLLETGKVVVNSKDSEYGRTPLLFAARNGHEAVVKLLLETGKADLDSVDNKFNRTPLLWAREQGYEAVVQLLQPSTG
jgi:ankyrin repeat protein